MATIQVMVEMRQIHRTCLKWLVLYDSPMESPRMITLGAALLFLYTISLDGIGAETGKEPQLNKPKKVVIPKLKGELQVDGKLDEAVWKKAVVMRPFVVGETGRNEREGTEVRIWYDHHALYLGWTCKDADIQATFTKRDSHFWEEEVVEFFVTPKELNRYFELQWNPLGGVFDAIITNDMDENGKSKKFTGDWNFTAKTMKSAVTVDGTVSNSEDRDKQWQVEVIVPFADLNLPAPKGGDVWRGNFYRFNREKGKDPELLSFSAPIWPGFHQPARFAFLEFGK